MLPTKEYLEECFTYDPETGLLYWKRRPRNHFKFERDFNGWNTKYSGKVALNMLTKAGYLKGTLDGIKVYTHRVIWKLCRGTEPEEVLHENGNKSDNRICKLSGATHAENMRDQKKPKNNSSGCTGVYWNRDRNKWHARIHVKGKNKNLGFYTNINDAVAVRKAAEVQYGYHPNHGRE